MFPTQFEMSALTKSTLENNFALYVALSSKTLESVEKLVSLNLSTAKASLEQSAAATKQMLAAQDPEEFLSVIRDQAKPSVDKAIAYGGHLFTITHGLHSEFSGATETQIAAIKHKVAELVEQAGSKAPAGSEDIMAIIKSIGNPASGYEQLTRAAKQTMEVLEANLNTALGQFTQAAATSKA